MANRFDAIGMWWADYPQVKTSTAAAPRLKEVAVPDTGWKPPRDFPNLSGEKILGIDTETKDLELTERGPGGVRGAGNLVGISLATADASWYFPMRHEYAPQADLNMDPDQVRAFVRDLVREKPREYVGANLLYDMEWLRAEEIEFPRGSTFRDVQSLAALLDEEARSYSLESISQRYLKQGKESNLLYQWAADSFGGKADGDQRAQIYRSPPSLVGPYAESDARLPFQLLDAMRPQMEEERLTAVYDMECALLPLLLDMRFLGVRVDLNRAEEVLERLKQGAKEAQAKIPHVDVWSNETIARAFQAEGLDYELTPAGNPSFTKEFLESLNHPLAQAITQVRQFEKAANPFVESYILGNHHNGRIHCQFHPMKTDTYGTVSGRFSSSNPNLQNIPSRDPVLGPLLRSLFIPEDGCIWRRGDYSQIEYRLLVHFAYLMKIKGAEIMQRRYASDPDTDFHSMVIALVKEITGVILDRKPAKNLNFGLVYGMGREKLIRTLGVSVDVGNRLYDAYFAALPAVGDTLKMAQRLAGRRGFIRTVMGRRKRFTETESRNGGEQRAFTHKALNACLQGSAADIIKRAMAECYRQGIFDATGIPTLTVHDELDFSAEISPKVTEAFGEMKRILETSTKLHVPLIVEMSEGATWGDCL